MLNQLRHIRFLLFYPFYFNYILRFLFLIKFRIEICFFFGGFRRNCGHYLEKA